MFTERMHLRKNSLVRMTFGPLPEKFVVSRRRTSSYLPIKLALMFERIYIYLWMLNPKIYVLVLKIAGKANCAHDQRDSYSTTDAIMSAEV